MRKILRSNFLRRVLFGLLGIALIFQGIVDEQGIAILLGLWPLAMGMFKLGCARGTCEMPSRER